MSTRSRICVIFNPTARGEKAMQFRKHLDEVAAHCVLKPTTGAGAARFLASDAVREGFNTIVAAGGDGTVNEVLNGIGDVPDGFALARLAVLPLGTINVFAKELDLPKQFAKNWEVILNGAEDRIDLPVAELASDAKTERRYFAQLAGAGLDARAIQLVDWNLKKLAGPLAYISAGLRAWAGKIDPVTVTIGDHAESGELVLIGNGRFYGGRLEFFPRADLRDGKLDICVFPRVSLEAGARCGWGLLTNQMIEQGGALHFSADTFSLSCAVPTPLQLDGDNVGQLPAKFTVAKQQLRVVVPSRPAA